MAKKQVLQDATPPPDDMNAVYRDGLQFQKDFQALIEGKSEEERAEIHAEMVEWRKALGQEPQPEDVWDYEEPK